MTPLGSEIQASGYFNAESHLNYNLNPSKTLKIPTSKLLYENLPVKKVVLGGFCIKNLPQLDRVHHNPQKRHFRKVLIHSEARKKIW